MKTCSLPGCNCHSNDLKSAAFMKNYKGTSPMKLIAIMVCVCSFSLLAKEVTILNVSYDPTRELYQDYNAVFAKYWQGKTGDKRAVNLSNGGFGKPERAGIDGVCAEVVRLALAFASHTDSAERE